MLYSQTPAAEKRRLFRERLASGELLRFPGAFNPLSARLIEQKGFDGVYISGAVLSADLGPARHRPDDPHRGRRPRPADRADDRAARDHRRRHRLRRADERRPHDPDPRGRGPRRHAHRGPDQPEALRAPRRQGRRRRADRDQAHPGRGRRAARPQLPDHGAHRHPRRRGAGCRDRPREGAGGCRGRRDLPRGDARPGRVRRDARGARRAPAREHDRVRQERAVLARSSWPTSASTS